MGLITASAEWPTGPVRLEWHSIEAIDLPVTGCHGFILGDSGLLVVNVRGRGYTIPGGHIHADESPEECLVREVREEARTCIGHLALVGYIVSDHSSNPAYGGPYPVRAAQAIFAARVTEALPFRPTREVSERREVPAQEVPVLHHEWNAVLDAALEAAMTAAKST